jgi:hypothetical protein
LTAGMESHTHLGPEAVPSSKQLRRLPFESARQVDFHSREEKGYTPKLGGHSSSASVSGGQKESGWSVAIGGAGKGPRPQRGWFLCCVMVYYFHCTNSRRLLDGGFYDTNSLTDLIAVLSLSLESDVFCCIVTTVCAYHSIITFEV